MGVEAKDGEKEEGFGDIDDDIGEGEENMMDEEIGDNW